MYKNFNAGLLIIILPLVLFSAFIFSSCDDAGIIIPPILTNEVGAKDRLDSANAQATRTYGVNAKLVMIFGKNVKVNGKTDISVYTALTSLDSIGAWLYIYRVDPVAPTFKVYAPDPVPSTTDCIEITSPFNPNNIVGLITDTSARNSIAGALLIILQQNIGITTPSAALINSDVSLFLADSTNPVIKFDSSYTPSASILNGSVFFSSGTSQTVNMFLIPAPGTLHIPTFIPALTGFPNDLWICNYKKTDAANVTQNLVLGTIVQGGTTMSIPNPPLTSKVINLSKYVSQ